MPHYGSGRQRESRYRPYRTTPLPSHGNRSCQDDHYGPNESLFDRESVLDMVSGGATPTYESDYENSEPTGTESTLFSHD